MAEAATAAAGVAEMTGLNQPPPGRLLLSRLLLDGLRLSRLLDRLPANRLLLDRPRLAQRHEDRVADVP